MDEFHFSEVQVGRLFSAFLIGYAFCQSLGGWLADSWGADKTLRISAGLWVLLTLAFTAIGWGIDGMGLGSILLTGVMLRFLLGLAQAPLFPAACSAVAHAIPAQMRTRANALVLSGVSIGSALAPLLISSIML